MAALDLDPLLANRIGRTLIPIDAFRRLLGCQYLYPSVRKDVSSVRAEDVPQELIDKEREIYKAQALEMGKPENVVDKIVDGKMGKFFKDNCLLDQPYVREPEKTVADLLNELIAKIGENISIKRFSRFQIGES